MTSANRGDEMLRYETDGLYGEGLLSSAELPEGEVLGRAAKQLEARFESGELGFPDAADTDAEEIEAYARGRLAEGWTDQIVIGIGGSSLGARAVLHSALPQQLRGLRTHFAENLDPESVDRLFSSVDPSSTLIVVITKSGTTIETMSQFWIAWRMIAEAVGEEESHHHIIAITDPAQGELRKLVVRHGWDHFPIPSNVGGRFSVLTAVGLLPLALAGYPIRELLQGARQVRDTCQGAAAQEWARAAAEHVALMQRGVDELVMMAYADRLSLLVDWFCQLWAESLGKARDRSGATVHAGITPIKALGVIDQHSQVQLYMEGPKNKHVTFLEVQRFERDREVPVAPDLPTSLRHLQGRKVSEIFAAELAGTRAALRREGRATSRWIFSEVSPRSVGAFLYAWQIITAMAGELLDLNAFDQPGVELGKKIAHGLLGSSNHEEFAEMGRPAGQGEEGGTRELLVL
jgi:glucose-6-phosphate isomerase